MLSYTVLLHISFGFKYITDAMQKLINNTFELNNE